MSDEHEWRSTFRVVLDNDVVHEGHDRITAVREYLHYVTTPPAGPQPYTVALWENGFLQLEHKQSRRQ